MRTVPQHAIPDTDYRYVIMTTPPRRLYAAEPPSRIRRLLPNLNGLSPVSGYPDVVENYYNSAEDAAYRCYDAVIKSSDLRKCIAVYIDALKSSGWQH